MAAQVAAIEIATSGESQTGLVAIRTYDAQCKSRCGIICYVKDGTLVRIEADPQHPNGPGDVGLCPKGHAIPELVYNPQRLKYPMKRSRPKGDPNPGWVRISWDEALETVAARLNGIKSRYGAEAVAFYPASPGSSPSNDYYPWFFRLAHAFGSPNIFTTTHTCNWHKDSGSIYTYGTGIPDPDFERTACMLIWGHNPQFTWRAHLRDIRAAKSRGAKLIVIDPRGTGIASEADLWVQVRPGTDGALALSMINVIISEGLYDREFLTHWTNGPLLVRTDDETLLRPSDVIPGGDYNKYMVWDKAGKRPKAFDPVTMSYEEPETDAALTGTYKVVLTNGQTVECKTSFQLLAELASKYSPEEAERITWARADAVREAARMFATIKPACYYTYNGLEQHTNAMQTNRAVCILYTLTGNYDSPGGNCVFPTVAVNSVFGREFLPPEVDKKRLGFADRPLGPARTANTQAYEVYKAILTEKPYPIKGLVSIGGNALIANADTLMGKKALEKLEFFVAIDLFETPTSQMADVILPASTFAEGMNVKTTFEQGPSTSSFLQLRKEVIPPLYESWPDMKIIFELARRLGLGDKFWDGDVEAGLNYLLAPSGITVEDLRKNPGGIFVELPVKYKKYAEKREASFVGFNSPTKMMEIYSTTFKQHGYEPLPIYKEPLLSPYARPDLAQQYPLILITAKTSYFCQGQHRAVPSLRKKVPYPYAELHPDMAKELSVEDGDWIVIETPMGSIRATAKITDKIDPRVVCAQHGWWQGCPQLEFPAYDPFSSDGANVNLIITNDYIDPISGSVPLRSGLCRVRKA